MTKAARIPRELPELVAALRQHVELLREYMKKAFEEGDPGYLGEVAGKLRLLALDRGSNTPLLLKLMYELDVDVEIRMNPLVAGEPKTLLLDEYLDSLAFGGRTSQGYVKLTHSDVIAAWAQQTGAAHEDWALEEPFVRFARSGISIGGWPAGAATLRIIAKTVLSAADDFLGWLTPERIASRQR